VETDMA